MISQDFYIEVLETIGCSDVSINWQGFGAQGDGACIEGRYAYQVGFYKDLTDICPCPTLLGIARRLQVLQRKNFYKLTFSRGFVF